TLFYPGRVREDFPVTIREVKDVTGAGDTVLAMLTCAMANRLTIAEATQLSNVAAGIAIERVGCARVSLAELARGLLEVNVANKVFDEEHLFALQEVLSNRKVVVVGLESTEVLSARTYGTLRQLAQRPEWAVLIYLRDANPHQDFVDLLISLRE